MLQHTAVYLLIDGDYYMDNYTILLDGLKKFYKVNDLLLSDLEKYSIDETGRSLEDNFKLYAANHANKADYETIKTELDYLNSEPHSISEMEIMYEIIDGFSFLED